MPDRTGSQVSSITPLLDQENAKQTGYQFRLILNWERDLI